MSEQTIRVDQFIVNKLQPNIDALNLSLVSMEENGYDNKPMRDTRNKLNKLLLASTFLKEYAEGNEQMDISTLDDIMRLAGESSISTRSNARVLQATRDSIDINDITSCDSFLRVYLNDEILKTELLPPMHEAAVLKIFGPKSATAMTAVVTYTGSPAQPQLNGVNSITIEGINLFEINGISIAVTVTVCGITYTYTLSYIVQDVTCESTTFWIGSTLERFTIADEREESTTISIDPNNGSNKNLPGIQTVTHNWITTSTEMENILFREDSNIHEVTFKNLDCHVLIMLPEALEITAIDEIVIGAPVSFAQYGQMPDDVISPSAKIYNVYYIRDAGSTTCTDIDNRIFRITLNKK